MYIYIFIYTQYLCICIFGSEAGSIRSTSFKLSCFHPGLPGMYLGFYLLMQSTESRVGTSEVPMIRCRIFVWETHIAFNVFFWKCVARYLARFKKNINMPDLYRLFFFHSCLVVKMPILSIPFTCHVCHLHVFMHLMFDLDYQIVVRVMLRGLGV